MSGGWGCAVEDDAEVARVGVAVVARHQEVLGPGGLERDEQACLLATNAQAVWHVLGKRGVGAGFDLDPLVGHERGDRAVEHVDRLVLAGVRVDGWLVARADAPFDAGPLAVGLLTGQLQLGARAVAGVDGATGAGARQNRITQGHLPLPSLSSSASERRSGRAQSAGRRDAHGYRQVHSAGVGSPVTGAGEEYGAEQR